MSATPGTRPSNEFGDEGDATPSQFIAKSLFAASPTATDASVVDEHSAHFTYEFLRGLDTTSPNRPRKIDIKAKDLDKMGNMERQYWEIKKEHFDVVIFFKKGKFYELYDCDAVISAREFNLKLTADTTNRGKMRMTGVPEQSFAEWARLFVFKGYKVGRVEQMELDEAAGAKQKVVPRHLVQILTKGTVSDAAMLAEHDAYFVVALAAQPDSIDAVAIDVTRNVFYACPCSGSRREDVLNAVAALLLHLSPKEVVLESDAAIKRRCGVSNCADAMSLLHADLASIVSSFAAASEEGAKVSVERIDGTGAADVRSPNPAVETLQAYFTYLKLTSFDLTTVLAAANGVTASGDGRLRCGVYDAHLSGAPPAPQDGRQGVGNNRTFLDLESLNVGGGLVLDAATIENLEITTNLRDGSARDTLLQRLCHCVTGGGKRLFRKWLLRPLTCATLIDARQDAVDAILGGSLLELWRGGAFIGDVAPVTSQGSNSLTPDAGSLKRTRSADDDGGVGFSPSPGGRSSSNAAASAAFKHLFAADLERNLAALSAVEMEDTRIAYVDPLVVYDKNLDLVINTIRAFEEGCSWATSIRNSMKLQQRSSALLDELLASMVAVEGQLRAINQLFDKEQAARDRRVIPKPGAVPAYDAAVATMEALEAKFKEKLTTYRKTYFGNDNKVAFCEIGKDLFLIEVPIGFAKVVQQSLPQLQERTRTTKTIKYSDSGISAEVEAYRKAETAKGNALVSVLRRLAGEFTQHFAAFFTAAQSFSYIDCLMSLARTASAPGMCRPVVRDVASPAGATIAAENIVHPMLSHRSGMVDTVAAVANSVTLSPEQGAVLLLTGPNMGGKSTLMRTVAVGVLMAQIGGYACASALRIDGPMDRIFTRIGARDVTHRGMSTLFVELTECAAICEHATSRSLCLVDELGRGTSTHDGYAIAHATLMHLTGRLAGAGNKQPERPLVIFSTHYHALAHSIRHSQDAKDREGIQLGYMDFAIAASQPLLMMPSPTPPRSGGGITASPSVVAGGAIVKQESADSLAGFGHSQASVASTIDSITFLYKLVPGICSRSYGVEVAVKAGIAVPIVQEAQRRSRQLAKATMQHLMVGTLARIMNATDLRCPALRAKLAADSAAIVMGSDTVSY